MSTCLNEMIRTLKDVKSDFSSAIIPAGTIGTIVECYTEPEGYAVDLTIPNNTLVGDYRYENVILYPGDFVIIDHT